jgi:hypothetical protein
MAKKALLVVFTIECLILAVLLCREWTLYYIGSGQAEAEYQSVYRDKIEDGDHPVTADIDAGTTSFVIWWGGTICIFFGVALGGPYWARQQLWPETQMRDAAEADTSLEDVGWQDCHHETAYAYADSDDPFDEEYEPARVL